MRREVEDFLSASLTRRKLLQLGLVSGAGATASLALRGVNGRRVVLGIRPEDLQASPAGDIDLTIEVVEPLGSQQFVCGSVGRGQAIVASIDARLHPNVGDHVRLSMPAEDVHFFDGETGQRVGE